MSGAILRPVRGEDREEVAALLTINRANVPAVGEIPLAQLERFAAIAARFTVAEIGGELAGYLIALAPDADYDSPNFIWFLDRGEPFLYVDRLAVRSDLRRRGLGRRLYDDLARHAREIGCPRITCEVNLEPRNEVSLDFHRALGFREVGRAHARGHLVAYLEWSVGLERSGG